MRKSKPRMTKKERMISDNRRKIDKICRPIYHVEVVLATFVDYLQQHRDLYNDKETYIKPYLKGYLTSVINKMKNFIMYEEVIKNKNYNNVKTIIEDNFNEELNFDVKSKKEFFERESEVNCKLFKTYACALACIGTAYDMFLNREKNPIYNEYKYEVRKILKEFKVYDNFWQNEVEKIYIKIV